MINYTELKAAMEAKGLAVSEGDSWNGVDAHSYRQFLYFGYNNLPDVVGFYGLQYTELLTAQDEEFPGAGGDTPPVRALQSIAITGTATAAVGATSQLTATGTYNVAPLTEDLTSSAVWVSDTTANATVAAGLVTGVAAGTSSITASIGEVTSAPTTFTVTAAPARTLQSIAITGSASIVEGATAQLTATGTYNVAPLTEDITDDVDWLSSVTATATVNTTGIVTAVAEGSTDITASLGSVNAPAHTVTVTAAP